ncbi:uncharacterized protein LOC112597860 [Melanaphis sacchari]|uniref:uncharacterized protein LOC112597860 n=1 Tax=Melanaphis sacchari TaxID=742174 RepID=UPI000DC12F0C|nr:uncharacterized protein LOC112597860 [Melanaphis sacchari]
MFIKCGQTSIVGAQEHSAGEVEVINSTLHNEVQNDTHREGNSVDVFNDVHVESGAKKGMEVEKRNEPDPYHNYFIRPNENFLAAYLQYHPHQPQTNIPFSAAKAYTRKDGGNCMWVTFISENPAIFCILCILYAKYTDNNTFIHGITD